MIRMSFYTSYCKKRLQRAYFLYVILLKAMKVKESCEEKGHEIALRNNCRHYLVDRGYQSHSRRCIDDDRSGNDRRPSYGALNCYRSKHPARDGYCPCNNQPWEQKSLAGRIKDGNERTLVRHIARSDANKGWLRRGSKIAPRNNQQNILHRKTGWRERLATIARHIRWLLERRQWSYCLCRVAKGATTTIFLMLRAAVLLPGSLQRLWFNHRETRGCNNQIFICCQSNDDGRVRTTRSNNGKWWLIGSARLCQATAIKPQRCVALASNDDYIFYIALQGRAKTTKIQSLDHNKNIACKRASLQWLVCPNDSKRPPRSSAIGPAFNNCLQY